MNIQIYLQQKEEQQNNILASEYIYPNIFEKIWIYKYLSYNDPHVFKIHRRRSKKGWGKTTVHCLEKRILRTLKAL